MILGGNLYVAPLESPKVDVPCTLSLSRGLLTEEEDLGYWYRDRDVSQCGAGLSLFRFS